MQCASTGQSSFEGISTSYKCTTDSIIFCKEARCLSLKSYSQTKELGKMKKKVSILFTERTDQKEAPYMTLVRV